MRIFMLRLSFLLPSLLLFLAAPAAAQTPTAGPVEVFAQADHQEVTPGQFSDVTLAVINHSTDSTVSVRLGVELTWADGSSVTPFNINTDNPVVLDPDGGLITFLFFQVPADAALGTATFTVTGRVGRISGGTNRSDYDKPLGLATDSVTFQVVAP